MITEIEPNNVLVAALKTGDKKKIQRAQRAIERAEDAAKRDGIRQKRLDAAAFKLNQERIAQEKLDKAARADQAEADLRKHGEPYCVIVFGASEWVIDLSQTELVASGTAAEGARRLIQAARNGWHSQVIATRNAGKPMPPVDLSPMLTSSSGLLQAAQRGLVAQRNIV